jgi:hypothetical protein
MRATRALTSFCTQARFYSRDPRRNTHFHPRDPRSKLDPRDPRLRAEISNEPPKAQDYFKEMKKIASQVNEEYVQKQQSNNFRLF